MAVSICPECGNEVFTDNYLYTGNHAAYDKGYNDSMFKIVGYRFYCRNEVEQDGDLFECDNRWEEYI